MKISTVIYTLITLLLLTSSTQAMTSPSYKMDWFVPLPGGGTSTSSHFGVNLTVGQTLSGTSASPNYQVEFGYWAVLAASSKYLIHLPLLLKN